MGRAFHPGAAMADGIAAAAAAARPPDHGAAQVLRLSGGRRLGYAEYGDRRGAPVMFFHGTPGSRRVAGWADEAARRRGIRLIAPDRPGFGLSDFQPGRTLGAWPADVLELADTLGVARFAVAGVSGGGPYVAACAWRIAGRLTRAAIISGIGPLHGQALAPMLPRAYRAGFAVVRGLPAAVRVALGLARLGLRHAPGCVLASVGASLPEADRAILRRPPVRALLLDDAREAMRQGTRGALQELILLSRPWDVPLGEIRMPVRLWHGEDDAQVPVAIARRVAATLPTCRASFLPGAGHLWALEHLDEVLAGLA
jgi:pimeloyl-ACP methyl ester carboxylesterase